jgi:hypothetical protein
MANITPGLIPPSTSGLHASGYWDSGLESLCSVWLLVLSSCSQTLHMLLWQRPSQAFLSHSKTQSQNESEPAQKSCPLVYIMNEFYNTEAQHVSNRLGLQAGENMTSRSAGTPHVVQGTQWGGGYNLAAYATCKSIRPLITRIVPNRRYGRTLGTWALGNKKRSTSTIRMRVIFPFPKLRSGFPFKQSALLLPSYN